MKKIDSLLASIAIISIATCSLAWAEESGQSSNPTVGDIWTNLAMGNNPDNYRWLYTGYMARYVNDDGSYVETRSNGTSYGFEYEVVYYNANGERAGNVGWVRTNLKLNGENFPGKTPDWPYQTYDVDEQGRPIAYYGSYYTGNLGVLQETYKYADNGQMLVYNPQGELVGAYDNWFGKMISQNAFSNKPTEMNHVGSDGNYIVKDSNDNVLEVYNQNGDYTKNKYNSKGELLSSNKYDKDGNVKESTVNVYDGGGNVVQQYKNGQLIYAKKIYTPAEAAAATHDGNDNIISISW